MRLLALFAMILSIMGCDRGIETDTAQAIETKISQYPKKVEDLQKLIQQLKPGTKWQEWFKLVDLTIKLPEEDVMLDGGCGMFECWATVGIGAGDEWALSIRYHQDDDEIWEANVVRTSISKCLANEHCDFEEIYPHYYKGEIVQSAEEKQTLIKK